jgi:hydrophobe/amphiphile efflux-1 (HAE1) family protein
VNVSAPFIRRPIATSLLAVAMMLAGLLAFTRLPISPLPRVDYPTISVGANLPGASPETMASSVATPLERRFGRIAGVTEITSSSGVGSTNITLQLDLDRDVDAAARDVQAAINAAAGELPSGMPSRPTYRKVNPADAPTLVLALRSKTLPLPIVFDQANSILAQKIAQLEGVGQVTVGGGQQPAVRVQVDPSALASLGLGMSDVRTAIVQATANSPKGSVDSAGTQSTIDANDQLLNAEGFRSVVLATRSGSIVHLSDVARVFDDIENNRAAGWIDGKRAVVVLIRRQPGANILAMNERVRALLPELAKSISPAIEVSIALDRTATIRASVEDVETTLGLSVLLVVGVVFVFLRSGRATAVPSVAVPLSLLGTFGAMYLLDYSLDNLSLMALTISTGFVVDDAIVVTENVARYIELGMTPKEAALKGAREIGFTIVSITASLLAVFLPILLMGGIVGRLFREFAVTLSIAIAISAVVSLTLTPMMSSRLLRATHDTKPGLFFRTSERAFDALLRGYARGLKWVLSHRRFMLAVTLLTIALTVYLYIIVPKGLFPQQDTGQLMGTSEAAQDASFDAMRRHQEDLNAVLADDPDIDHFIAFCGGGSVNNGMVFIGLKPADKRTSNADQVIARLRGKLGRVEGVNMFLQSTQDVRMGARFAKTQFQYTLQDADLAELRAWVPKVADAIRKLPQVKDVSTDQQAAALELRLPLDRDTASRMGVTAQNVDDALYDAFGQRQVATTFTELGQYRVILEALPEIGRGPESLGALFVKPANGAPIPLSQVVGAPVLGTAPLSIAHQGQFPATTISFNLAPNVALGQAIDAVHEAERAIRMPAGLHAQFQGTAQAFTSSLSTQPMLIALALAAVYVVLGVLYESYRHPITILSTLPSAGVGALLALLIYDVEFSVIALIGILLLVGIVKKNAIMMIDFAIVAQKEGLSPTEAIEKACLLRFRPILMTTLAALFGALPLAIAHGTGAELRKPLGITIVGGLLLSQLLTLFTTPVVYLALESNKSGPPKPEAKPIEAV